MLNVTKISNIQSYQIYQIDLKYHIAKNNPNLYCKIGYVS